jgi:TPP-dependent pyruvate/acetoin dehydrogenase alpha subunit
MGPHNTSDDPTRYVDPVELDEHRAFDPVERVRRYLTAEGLVDETSEQALVQELRAEVDAAFAEAEGSAPPGAEAIFDHVYARPPGRLDAQRAAAQRRAGAQRDGATAREPG